MRRSKCDDCGKDLGPDTYEDIFDKFAKLEGKKVKTYCGNCMSFKGELIDGEWAKEKSN